MTDDFINVRFRPGGVYASMKGEALRAVEQELRRERLRVRDLEDSIADYRHQLIVKECLVRALEIVRDATAAVVCENIRQTRRAWVAASACPGQ